MKKETVFVEGMSCEHCVKAITRALKSVAGVINAEVSLSAKTAEVEFDESIVGIVEIKKAIVEEGYPVLEHPDDIKKCFSCG